MNESGDWDPPREVTNALRDIGEYGENIDRISTITSRSIPCSPSSWDLNTP